MRLLYLDDKGEYSLAEFIGNEIPPYAILSHTWGADGDEITLQNLMNCRSGDQRPGYRKIRFCVERAAKDGLKYSWIDTCCIDKSSSAELQESINSMFRWYQNADRCYVYLSDVRRDSSDANNQDLSRWKPSFRNSRWFTRGWTLQELIAPVSVEFFSYEGEFLSDRTSMVQTICDITGIAIDVFKGKPLHQFSEEERLKWVEERRTKREEDKAYCLLGIFDVQMPLLYGEGRENAFRRLRKEMKEISSNKVLPLREEQKRTLMDSLKFDQIDARQLNIKSAHAKTCRWLLRNPEYLDWLDSTKLSEHHGFLWIKGKPGTGKSTLMKFALANARRTMKNKTLISFFFNARGEDLEKSTMGTYRSLLLQLLEQIPALQDVFDTLRVSASGLSADYKWSTEVLKTLLEDAILGLGETSVVCFIDALDECAEVEIRDMISFFEHIGELALSRGVQLQVCFSSRHYPHITIKRGLHLVLEGQEGHTQDITNYLESELKIGHSQIAQQVRRDLQEKASGIFMWVVLVTGILNKEHDSGRIHALRRRLQEIPGDLHELFRDILTRDSQNRGELILCIQWILFAKQPLSPEQLYFAILSGVEPDAVSQWDSEDITHNVIRNFILNSSKGLAEITTTKLRKVQFIHESVRDFLLKEDGLGTIWPDFGDNFVGQSHERLKQCCLQYMTADMITILGFPEHLPFPKASTPQAVEIRNKVNGSAPFLGYATDNVLYHSNAAGAAGVPQGHFLAKFPLSKWVHFDNLFEKRHVRRHGPLVSLMYLLGERNHSELIRAYPHPFDCLGVEGERYGCPMFAAMATGSKQAIKAFIEGFQTGDSQWCRDDMNEYYECNQTYIKRDFSFSVRRSMFSYSVEFGYTAIVSHVLNLKDIDLDERELGEAPIWWAIKNGHEAVVKVLLNTGRIDVNSKDERGSTPLIWAAQHGNEGMVKILLDEDKIDIDAKDDSGQTALLLATKAKQEAMVKVLIDTGRVDVDSNDRQERTALSWAAENGHEVVVKMLLDTGRAEVDSQDYFALSPLAYAARNGREAVVKMLLDTGKADINSKDWNERTPLLWAAENGYEAVVRMLLDTGRAEVDSKDNEERTALSYAEENGHEAVIKILLNTERYVT